MTSRLASVAMAGSRQRTLGERLVALGDRSLIHVALLVVALLWLVPSVGLFVTSLRPRPDIASSGWWTILGDPDLTLNNYQEVLTIGGMGASAINSLMITVPSTILPIFVASLAAFAFAWIRFPFRDTIFLLIVGLMVVPIQIALVPTLILFRTFGLGQGLGGIILAHTAFGLPFAIFLLRNFFVQLPVDLIEAARMDGASPFGIFGRIVVPLSLPALASLTVFQFLWVWNDLLMALVFVQDPNLLPLTVRINQLLTTYGVEFHLLSAGSFVLMVMPLIVFFGLQRYFIRGITAGAVK